MMVARMFSILERVVSDQVVFQIEIAEIFFAGSLLSQCMRSEDARVLAILKARYLEVATPFVCSESH